MKGKPRVPLFVYIRGGGDIASGVALRLFQAGLCVLICELPQPLVIRRTVSFAETVYQGEFSLEGIHSRLVKDLTSALNTLSNGQIPVIIDPQAGILHELRRHFPHKVKIVLVDGRMTKKPPEALPDQVDFYVGLGPGFQAGINCHAVIETNRGHHLGRIIWEGQPQADTGIPAQVNGYSEQRVLRAPADGVLTALNEIGDHIAEGQIIANISGEPLIAPISGILRGLIKPGISVCKNQKIADIDPRDDPKFCYHVSDKSRAIGGAVLVAILSRRDLRPHIWKIKCG